jgi:glycosyltransferase involved in cell wall biosynthesis
MADRGHEIYAALRPASPLIAELKKLPAKNIFTLSLRNALDAASARNLSRLVNANGIQIVHAHMARDYPLAAYAIRKNPNSRLIVTRHVLFALNPLHRITLGRASRVIAVSEAVASELNNNRVAAREKITVVHNGIDTSRFAAARDAFKRNEFLSTWNLPSDSLLIGTVGELTPLKGQAEFLNAAVQVTQQYHNAYFIVAGTDTSDQQTNAAALEELISRLRLSEKVRLVPWLDDIAQLYCALDVFVSASHTESFGLAIAEAMACSTPVVATATGGAREIVQPGRTGVLVPVGNIEELAEAILYLLGDKGKRMALAQSAQQAMVAEFDLSRMIDKTERIYIEELEGRLDYSNSLQG